MRADAFAVLAEPTRRKILDELRVREMSVNDLVSILSMSQPAVSKHLKVLRDSGLASVRVDAQKRVYRLDPAQLRNVDDWLAPYRSLMNSQLDKLEQHLDRKAQKP